MKQFTVPTREQVSLACQAALIHLKARRTWLLIFSQPLRVVIKSRRGTSHFRKANHQLAAKKAKPFQVLLKTQVAVFSWSYIDTSMLNLDQSKSDQFKILVSTA